MAAHLSCASHRARVTVAPGGLGLAMKGTRLRKSLSACQ
jgi:hypothetical protein